MRVLPFATCRDTWSFSVLALAALLGGSAVPLDAEPPQLRPDDLIGLEARLLGPAVSSGRVTAIDAVADDPDTVWVGAASGGVWKSTDGALTWTPVFDDAPVHSIGALAIDPRDPDVVWVGTGEGNPRNTVSVGDGIYRTTDGGATWSHVGLDATRHIHRLRVDPDDGTVWAAALGTPWTDDEHRGVYRTRDAGATWDRVLFVDDGTGAADLDRAGDGTLLAALWQHRRQPWSFTSGGPGSGLYRSTDGGDNWRRLDADDGLPPGDLGRIGVAFAPSNPSIAYALVEHAGPDLQLLRSIDGGATWSRVASSLEQPIGGRPFYYADLRVDPRDPDRVYSLWTGLSVSDDGGRTWRTIAPFSSVHADHHALWIAPHDPTLIYDGNDGGVAVSRSRGETWRYVENLPIEQFYHVRVDDAVPFNVYGGTQDNGSWVGPSAVFETAGVRAAHWREVDRGDGFDTVPAPGRPGQGYSMMPTGIVSRFDLRTGEQLDVIRPEAPAGEPELRYGWDAPFELDPFDDDRLYLGSQFVHRSDDRGDTWTRISPDLTTNNPAWQGFRESGGLTIDVSGAENFTTLSALAASPLQPGLLWAGSDDGRLHRTRDGGDRWQRLDAALPGAPRHGRVSAIVASTFDAEVAYVALDAHGLGDPSPYLFRTDDGGASWTRLAVGSTGWIHIVHEDREDPRLLFVGTELGLWLTADGGSTWQPFHPGLPRAVAVRDLAYQARDDALVIATHGRGIFIIDHLQPLRDLIRMPSSKAVQLIEPRPAVRHTRTRPPGPRFPGDGEFEGSNPPYGASLYLWHRDALDTPPQVTVSSMHDDRPIRRLDGPTAAGLHRVVWDLRPDGPTFQGMPISQFEVLPGRYRVTVAWNADDADNASATAGPAIEQSAIVEVQPDPRLADIPAADREARRRAIDETKALLTEVLAAMGQIQALQGTLQSIDSELVETDQQRQADELAGRLAELSQRLVHPPSKHSRHRDRVFDEVAKALWVLEQSVRAPSPTQLRYLERAEVIVRPFLDDLRRLGDDIGRLSAEITATDGVDGG